MKKNDVILLLIIVVAAAALFAVLHFALADSGDFAVVFVDGEEYARLPLDEDAVLTIKTEYGTNVLTVKDGQAYVTDADCPDKTCVKTGSADELKSIVCLPHKLTVTIESEGGR